MKEDIKGYSVEELEQFFLENSFPRFNAKQVFNWVFKKRIEDFGAMSNISKSARKFLQDNFYFSRLALLKKEISQDNTQKFLFKLSDGSSIETVLIPERERITLCISSQVGCKFLCKFCMSGSAGFKRNLSTSEIINQYLEVNDMLSASKITNIVFMGTGEPLDNFANVIKAIKIFMEPQGLYLGKNKICVSTAGLAAQIEALAGLGLGIALSVSLHSAFDDIRSKVMPINRKHPLKELITAVKKFTKDQRKPVTFEYVMIHSLNTRPADAVRLAHLLNGFDYKVNLIPYNAASLEFKSPSDEEIRNFTAELKSRGVFFTLRKPRGQDIHAACGQLRALWSATQMIAGRDRR